MEKVIITLDRDFNNMIDEISRQAWEKGRKEREQNESGREKDEKEPHS